MATRDIYETTFDEDVQSDSTANQCPECDGRVITNTAEIIYFFNIDGAVVCGDSLAMTKRRAWKTRGTMLGGEVAEVDPDDLPWPEAAFDEPVTDDEPTAVEHESIEQSELGAWGQ